MIRALRPKYAQRGVALLLILFMALTLGLCFLCRFTGNDEAAARARASQNALSEAKNALIGFTITYRETHPEAATGLPVEAFGFLPCPDSDNDGEAESSCGEKDVPAIGRLPWKTLGLPPLRDSDAQCLWYAVSGRAKNSPKSDALNWDTPGQLIVRQAAGALLAGSAAHERPFAVILAPHAPLTEQTRTTTTAAACGGNNSAANYLEMLDALWSDPHHTGTLTIQLASPDSIDKGLNNDQGLWIGSSDIFSRVRKRGDFKHDIDTLLTDLAFYLNSLAPASLPAASSGNKGTDLVLDNYLSTHADLPTRQARVLDNWRDNLLYAGGPEGNFTVNASPTRCRAILLFGGARGARSLVPAGTQTRSTDEERNDPGMYLEGDHAARFPDNGVYTGATEYLAAVPTKDLVRCITGRGAAAVSFSESADFSRFAAAGAAVTTDTTSAPASPTLSIADATGSSGGCFWFADPIPLAGKTLRTYYEFQFFHADAFALDESAIDRGNGFTLQLLRGDIGAPPSACGSESNMGALAASDIWGSFSFIVETDVRRDSTRADPKENHSAIMLNGNLSHTGATLNATCNGTANGCRHTPANAFEELPTPAIHRQRMEIHTGCNATCTTCSPANHIAPNTYARISVWVDCANCNDIARDMNRTDTPPAIQRCTPLYSPEMDTIYFGLTGGFRSGISTGEAPAQGVRLQNFSLRSD